MQQQPALAAVNEDQQYTTTKKLIPKSRSNCNNGTSSIKCYKTTESVLKLLAYPKSKSGVLERAPRTKYNVDENDM